MHHSNIPVNTIYSPRRFAREVIPAHIVDMNRVRNLRKSLRLSQVELAEIVGCSQGMISKIEKGTANPTLDLIEALAKALKTEPASLFGLPETQQRAMDAMSRMDPDLRESALVVLEKMAAR